MSIDTMPQTTEASLKIRVQGLLERSGFPQSPGKDKAGWFLDVQPVWDTIIVRERLERNDVFEYKREWDRVEAYWQMLEMAGFRVDWTVDQIGRPYLEVWS